MTPTNLHPLAVLGPALEPQGGLKGYCRTTYAVLVALCGKPHFYNQDKVTTLWRFHCADGTVFDVYDWKMEATPQGEYDWHIGGSSSRALAAFERFTGLKTRPLDPTWLSDDPSHRASRHDHHAR
jgi:hypothetical protein